MGHDLRLPEIITTTIRTSADATPTAVPAGLVDVSSAMPPAHDTGSVCNSATQVCDSRPQYTIFVQETGVCIIDVFLMPVVVILVVVVVVVAVLLLVVVVLVVVS